jgi:predicted amidohydrolase
MPDRDVTRAAIIQHPPVFLNLRASLARAAELVAEAAAQGAQVVAFPETWLPGYPVWLDAAPGAALWEHAPAKALYRLLADNALTLDGPALVELRALAQRHAVHLVMGAHERLGATLYNALLLLHADGEQVVIRRKLKPTYTERLVWGQGDGSTLGTLALDGGVLGGLRLGGMICWEHWMPLLRAAMHAQLETIHVAQWPSVHDLHLLASRHYAFEGQCFVLAAGCVLSRGDVLAGARSLGAAAEAALPLLESIPGDDATLLMTGGSAVIGPDSKLVAGQLIGEPGILLADLDLGRVIEGRLVLDTNGHYSRPDVFSLHVDTRPQPGVVFEGPGAPQ